MKNLSGTIEICYPESLPHAPKGYYWKWVGNSYSDIFQRWYPKWVLVRA